MGEHTITCQEVGDNPQNLLPSLHDGPDLHLILLFAFNVLHSRRAPSTGYGCEEVDGRIEGRTRCVLRRRLESRYQVGVSKADQSDSLDDKALSNSLTFVIPMNGQRNKGKKKASWMNLISNRRKSTRTSLSDSLLCRAVLKPRSWKA